MIVMSSLIRKISGSLIETLSGVSQGSSSSTTVNPSTLGGKGSGASFDAASIDFSSASLKAAGAFSDSATRLGNAFQVVTQTKNYLDRFSAVVDDLYDLAKRASNGELQNTDRASLDFSYQDGIRKINDIISEAAIGESDFLNRDDIESILQLAGVDIGGTSDISRAFNTLAGDDSKIGSEQTSNALDPFNSSIDSLDNAKNAFELISFLKDAVTVDSNALNTISDELASGIRFAQVGGVAFQSVLSRADTSNVDSLANDIVNLIRNTLRDSSLSAHSDIDRTLAAELLSEN
jgi:hypothetical protein